MKKIFILLCICYITQTRAQEQEVTEWINNNAIVIEDSNPDNPLSNFSSKVPQSFSNATLFGFGEASHHGKEFFDLKAKFFKYLVVHQGVRLFLMEESYQAEEGINDWISGSAEGDARSVLNNFNMAIWYTNEVTGLLQWMRDYNHGKPYNERIRFYGIDNQFGKDINIRLRSYLSKYKVVIDESLLIMADSAATAQLKAGGIKGWDKKMLPPIKQLRLILEENKERLISEEANEYIDILRALRYLEQYTAYIAAPYSHIRDKDMYDNVLDILNLEEPDSKAFIWAHNEHINKKDKAGYKVVNLGNRLKQHFKDKYYTVGFDFGRGKLTGFNFRDGKNLGRVVRTLDAPYKKTYAHVLAKAQPDIFFIDMATAATNPIVSNFFSTKMQQLFLGGPGFDPNNIFLMKRKYSEAYDAIVFVKNISPATY